MRALKKLQITKVTQNFHLLAGIILLLVSQQSLAQVEEKSIRYAVSESGVYLYHVEPVPIGVGFNIYKRQQKEDQFTKLNDMPVEGIFYPDELHSYLGDIYWEIEQALETSNERETFFTLRSNSILGRLYTFVYPDIAEALGRLYIDETTETGDVVSYRIEFVDDLGEPTGDVLQETFTIEKHTPPSPQNVVISNDGYKMEIRWEYPPMERVDDKIIRFEIYESEPGSDELNLINKKIILRDDLKTEYLHFFTASRLGVEKQYLVAPVSVTGERLSVSEPVPYTVADNIAPAVIEGVRAEKVNGVVEITWPMSPETDLAGYKIYRTIDPTRGVNALQEELISADETVFIDSTAAEGEAYLYQITAVDKAGNEGKLSGSALLTIEDQTPPPAPRNVQAEFLEDGKVRVFWDPGEMPEDFSRFLVYRRSISPTDSTIYDLISNNDFRNTEFIDDGVSDLGLQEGMYYEYGVSISDSSRNFSDIIPTRIQIPDRTPPNPPSIVTVDNIDGNRVNLNWTNSSSGDVVTYILYREERGAPRLSLDTTHVTVRTFRDEEVEVGKEYRYAVSAIDSLLNQSEVTFSDYVFVKKNDPLRRVRNVRIVQGDEGPELYWEPVTSSHLVGYMVYRSGMSTGIYEPLTEEPVTATTFFLEDQEPGYWYRVRAIDKSDNESRPSEPVRFREN